MKKILIISDNETQLMRFVELTKQQRFRKFIIKYAYSFNNKQLCHKFSGSNWIKPINIKNDLNSLIENYYIIFSIHSKQIFPEKLVEKVRCINVHPGLNPYNRGWFPQVFSIINNLPFGATIHEMDKYLDHGLIIAQKPIKIEQWDTSLTAYEKVLSAEIELLDKHLINIIEHNYTAKQPSEEGNINLKNDFKQLCKIDISDTDTFLNHINKLRGLTHGKYKNAYFFDDKGNKIIISLNIEKQCNQL